MSTPRQTLSFLLRRFQEVGIRPHTKFGQNFLIDLNLLNVLLESAAVTPDDVVLEVGTGTGSLRRVACQRAAAVVTVEIDRQMFQLASEELEPFENVVMLQCDALKHKNQLNPEVIYALDEPLSAAPGRRLKLVANLPYNIATPLIANLLAERRPPQTMTVTIQKEVAERIVAPPGTKDYGARASGCRPNAARKSCGSCRPPCSGRVPRSRPHFCKSRSTSSCGSGFPTANSSTTSSARSSATAANHCDRNCWPQAKATSTSPPPTQPSPS